MEAPGEPAPCGTDLCRFYYSANIGGLADFKHTLAARESRESLFDGTAGVERNKPFSNVGQRH